MGSEDETVSELEFEFSEEEFEEAIKKKPGRPSNRTRELRERIAEAQKVTDLLGILNSGVIERLDRQFSETSGRSSPGGPIPSEKKKTKEAAEGFTEELLTNFGLIDEKFAQTNRKILGLTDEIVKDALKKYGPLAMLLAGVWIAEEFAKIPTKNIVKKEVEVPIFEQIPVFETEPQRGRDPLILRFKDGRQIGTRKEFKEVREKIPFPPVLHTSVTILISLVKILNAGVKLFENLGGFDLLSGERFVDKKGDVDLIKVLDFLVFGFFGSELTPF